MIHKTMVFYSSLATDNPFNLFFLSILGRSDFDYYSRSYVPSPDSHSRMSTPQPEARLPSSEPYPAWSSDKQIPMSVEEIEDIFLDLTQKFGFQRDSMRNMASFFSFSLFRPLTT